VVGEVGDVRQFGLDVPIEPQVYRPHAQLPIPWMTLVMRSDPKVAGLIRDVRRRIWSVNAVVPIESERTMDAVVRAAHWQPSAGGGALFLPEGVHRRHPGRTPRGEPAGQGGHRHHERGEQRVRQGVPGAHVEEKAPQE
jgi:hypothetical protein